MDKIITFIEPLFAVNTYLLVDDEHAIAIDPIPTESFVEIAKTIILDFAILTHEHYDHIRGVNELRALYGKVKVLCGEKATEGLSNPAINLSKYTEYIKTILPFGNGLASNCEYVCYADETLNDGQIIQWQGHTLRIKETPGHSAGSISILYDNKVLFSGDVLFQDYPTATRIPGGSTKKYEKTTKVWINELPQGIIVYPGHLGPFSLCDRCPE